MPYHNDLADICQPVKEFLMIFDDLLTVLRQFFIILADKVKHIVLGHVNHGLTEILWLPLSFMENAFHTRSVAKDQLFLFLSASMYIADIMDTIQCFNEFRVIEIKHPAVRAN